LIGSLGVEAAMDNSAIFYKAMAAFCRQHAQLEAEDESFWLAEARIWAERLKGKRAFWHQFADKPKFSEQQY
jgi:hypothetical protein